ncbi:heavy metal translocating P-type ATPase [Halomonas sp. MCCC 1A17488]|uniref:heavy metal translocating P-type ATPase n=1 Tax=unclassified Halomonas TaxID=2609666 RepID=UPI0018D22ADE|nr:MULTISPECIES: heavy metal translocating P-type ATPase [unclassified Halomonas]MCE8017633.1 heavy metal translocating P-type ATPase [Halomonas sp. MCCC 1A17488]MCG3240966.1 heavy metal translocating P-type ATPase [Halomonas sp. MCCC 1A17488]QPP48836.1 heavy metal translocating P-type ATPase [Halomonas sp. SS10-MC5]
MAERSCCSGSTCPTAAPAAPPRRDALPPDAQSLHLRIEAMCCPTEEGLLRRALEDMPGIERLDFDLIGRKLTVHHRDVGEEAIRRRIAATGMTAERDDPTQRTAPTASDEAPWWKLGVATLLALAAEASHWLGLAEPWLAAALALAAIALVGLPTWKKGFIALRHRTLNINALMSVAVAGALLIGQWAEAAMVLVLFTLAERIEARSLGRARNAIRELLDLAPERASVRQADGSFRSVAASDVAEGSLVRVRPGERLALDGSIAEGHPALDESPITGESLPVDKAPGEAVFAGSVNQGSEFLYRTTRAASDTTLARIIHTVEQAQASRAPTQRFIDRFAAVYTPTVFALALLVALTLPWLFGIGWLEGTYRALVLLVIACPCALVISTPVTIVSGLAAAARSGILIKGGNVLEQGHRLTTLAFDKTGTLTRGRPAQRTWQPLDPTLDAPDRDWLRALAAGLAARSSHPVSAALARAAEADGVAPLEVSDVQELPGHGVVAQFGGRAVWLGNRRLMQRFATTDEALDAQLAEHEARGETLVLLGEATRPLALFAVGDPLRAESREAIEALHRLGVTTLMLSGDTPASVAAVAAQAGIDEAHGSLLPEDKLAMIEARAQQGSVGMVGDGINDAPALARADIGFAMGALGSDAAIETADVALMDDDPRRLADFLRLSRRTRNILVQNIAIALGLKAVFMALAFTGHATLWMAVFADMGASLIVVANGLRLLRQPGAQGRVSEAPAGP